MKLTALILLLAPLGAQEPAALAIRNVQFDATKATVDFDVARESPKPVHSWLITVALGNGTSVLNPLNCSPAGHCRANVDFGEIEAGEREPEVRVSAVLFEDGTAAGDLRLLQSEIDDAQIRLRALESWRKDFHQTPPDIAYTSAVMNEREIVELLSAKTSLAVVLEGRLKNARERALLFPAPATPWAPSETVVSTRPVANHTARFSIVREEEHEGGLRLVLRNGYDKDIVAFAFTQRQPDGRAMRSSSGHNIAPGALEEFQYDAPAPGDPLELACVVFRDGSADGDPAVVHKMQDGWAGRKAERDRILPLVRAVANLPVPERAAATRKLIADLQAHPREQPGTEHSIDYVMGQQAARKTVLLDLRSFSLEESLKDLQE